MNAPRPPLHMRTLLVGCGPIAHLAKGQGPLVASDMSNVDELILPNGHGILIEEGIIRKISSQEELLAEYAPWFISQQLKSCQKLEYSVKDNIRVLDICGKAIVPGLIDSHSHLLWSGDRSRESLWRSQGKSYSEIASMGGGIGHTVANTRNCSESHLTAIGEERLITALSNGTTTLETKSGYGLNTESELKLLNSAHALGEKGLLPDIDLTWLGAHDTPPDSHGEKDSARKAYVESILADQLPQVIDQGLARSADVFCEPGWFSIEESEEILQAAKKGGLAQRMHVDEFQDGGGLELAAELGVATADHAHYSSHDARQKAHDAGVIQGFLPGTPYVMGEDSPPLKQCQDEGWAFSIATDFNPNCMTLSLPFIGSLAVNRGGLDPLSALVACTRNSGYTIPSPTPHGMIVEGGVADINILKSKHWQYWCLTPGNSPFIGTFLSGELIRHGRNSKNGGFAEF